MPSSIKTGEIARILKEKYDVEDLNRGFVDLCRGLELDYLLIDTHPGVNEETLLSIAISDALLLILRLISRIIRALPSHWNWRAS